MRWLTNPKVQFVLFLLLFYLATMFHLSLNLSRELLISCIGFCVLADILFTFLRKRVFFIPYSAVITGIILALIIDPSASWFQILTICAIAMGIKNFIRIGGKHIFNPVATGLVTGTLIFNISPSWWGASFYTPGAFTFPNAMVLSAILLLAFISCYRYKRYYTVVTYLFSFALISMLFPLSVSVGALTNAFLNPGNLFYAFVMVAEPMTSPVNKKRQILYGFTVALVYTILIWIVQGYIQHLSFLDSSLLALLIGNLLFFLYR